MRISAGRVLVAVLTTALSAQFGYAQKDRQGCRDHPMLSRMSGYFIERCQDQPFASHKFQTSHGRTAVEGHLTFLEYHKPRGSAKTARLEVIRNYVNAMKAIGGQVTYQGSYSASLKAMAQDREVWVDVRPGVALSYQLYIVEKQPLAQQVVADAAALLADLDRAGHTVLHGVFFDTDQAVVKPESGPTLTEIARLLRENPGMNAFVVGHTDMSGDLDHNLELSRRRAAAVVEALVTAHGVPRQRLTARGVGPLAPMGPNDTEAGRKLNRRVELVKR